jgi:hypothetical protein
MPKRKKLESDQPQPLLDPTEDASVETQTLPEPDNGHPEQIETVEPVEPPAKVKYSAEGSPRAVAAAARKIANVQVAPLPIPSDDVEPPDETDNLLADGHNMVIVQRQFPKSVDMADGSKRRCAVKLPDRYQCPTTREEIENDVFDRHGGKKYKCTIHPATTNGESTILGFFTIEHPDPEVEPYFDDAPTAGQQDPRDTRTMVHTSGGDPTMHETDGLAKLRADAERRLDRARVRKEMKELEAEAKRLEAEIDGDGKPSAALQPTVESDEVKKLRAELAEKDRLLAKKEVNDRFDKIENVLGTIMTTLAAPKPVEKSGDSELMKFITKKMETDSTQITALMTALTAKAPAPVHSSGDDLDKFLSRAEKLKAITSSTDSKGGRLSEIENRLIDVAWERLQGGDGGDETEDVAKLAVKEFAPILKTFVEQKMKQESGASGGAPIPQERLQQIYAEAAQAAAKKVTDDLAVQGIQLAQGVDGRLIAMTAVKSGPTKSVVPPRQHAGTKVVAEQRTSSGVVKQVSIKPTDLTSKTQPEPQPSAEPSKEGGDVKQGEFPLLGENGATLKIPFPISPGEMKYDRKRAVDFVLAGIRSEIRQQFPQKAENNQQVESYVASDAMAYLDDELLDSLEAIDNGPQLEALLMQSGGEASQINEIKKAGEDEVVASFLRRLIKTIQTEWIKEKAKNTK